MLSASHVKQLAAELGFSACGLAPAVPVDSGRAAELRRWLAEGCQADMHYLEGNLDKRLNPCLLVEGAKTVVSLAVNYYSSQVPPASGSAYRLARYAYGTDYHEVVKQLLRRLMQQLGLEEGRDGRVFVDTAPIDEKYWAQQCGLGWRGRHSQLILPRAGSYFFLGELVLVHPADAYDAPMQSHCGNCRRCIDACPTGALRGDGTLDARLCLSYLTIEQRGDLPAEAAEGMGHCFYGCDRCAEACPWNERFARNTEVEELQPRPTLLCMDKADWQQLTREQYTEIFRKSAVKRAKWEGLARNLEAVRQNLAAQGDEAAQEGEE